MKVKWSKKIPEVEGWYWIKYRIEKTTYIYPAEFFIFKSAGGSSLITHKHRWHNHGDGFHFAGKFNRTITFGPAIEEPNELIKERKELQRFH